MKTLLIIMLLLTFLDADLKNKLTKCVLSSYSPKGSKYIQNIDVIEGRRLGLFDDLFYDNKQVIFKGIEYRGLDNNEHEIGHSPL